ncbi:MAG: glycosyltransferase [Terracidiphilus sp.]
MREPGYPILLAGLLLTFGNVFIAVKLLNLLLAFGTAWLITRIVRRLSDRSWPMLAAASLYLFHPGTLIAESRGGVEILFGFLIVLFVVTLLNAIDRRRTGDFAVSGLILGVVVLVRSVPILFPVFLLGYLLVFERHRTSMLMAFRNIAILVLTMIAVLSPWIIRNYSLTGKFVPTASVLGVSAQAGQYICAHLSEGKPWWLLDREAAYERSRLAIQLGYRFNGSYNSYYQVFYRTNDEMAFSKFLVGRVVNEYKSSPALFVKVLRSNLFNFWFTGKTQAATDANVLVQLPYLFLAGIGLLLSLRNQQARIVAPIALLIAYFVAVSMPILAQARYSVPLVPLLSVLGTITLIAAQKRMIKNRALSAAVAGNDEESESVAIPLVTHDANDRFGASLPVVSSVIEEARLNLGLLGSVVELKPAPQANIQLSIVIPAYNEQARLPRTIIETLRFCTAHNLDFELIIADDGSQDETLALTQLFEEGDSRVRALACPHAGKGSAVRLGMLNAKGRFVLFMDADGATPLTEIPKLMAALEAGYDVAVGSRVSNRSDEVEVKTSIHRRVIGRVFAFFVNMFAIEDIADTQCGFKMFRHEAAMAIFSSQKTIGFAFDVEILFIAKRLALSIVEIPVNWVAQPGSKVNLVSDSIKMLWDITLIRWMHRNFDANAPVRHFSQSLDRGSEIS